ncbi:MAG: hypothetical protein Q4G03_00135 [Planctomycetia bacterium]|nr:hypothetical protein [Planctomycetia bacterium]
MTQTQKDDLTCRLDAQHDELLKKIDELDLQVQAAIEEWSKVVKEDDAFVTAR